MPAKVKAGVIGALLMIAASCNDQGPTRPTADRTSGASNVKAPFNREQKSARLRERFGEGGCAVTEVASGTKRGFALPRRRLPFAMPPVQHDPKTNKGNAHVVHMRLYRPNQTPVELSCWVPNTVTDSVIANSIHASKGPRWTALLSALSRARTIPDSAEFQQVSTEGQAFEAEMLVATPAPQAKPTRSRYAPLYNDGCESVSTTVEVYQSGDGTWVILQFEVDVCDDTGGDFFGWLIDNGYDSGTTVAVDASNYRIVAPDSVTFDAEVASYVLVGRIGWWWAPTGSGDPWTRAREGNDTTCTIQVHGSGQMEFTVQDEMTGEYVTGRVVIGASTPPDANIDSLGDNMGDTDDGSTGPSFATHPISAATGVQILHDAWATQPEWVYTQGCAQCDPNHPEWTEAAKNPSAGYGDCTDFVWYVVT